MPSGSYNEFTGLAGAISGTGSIGETVTSVIQSEEILTSLDDLGAVTTVGQLDLLIWVDDSSNDPTGLRGWRLKAGTDATNIPNGKKRPDDYNASTNAKVWVREI